MARQRTQGPRRKTQWFGTLNAAGTAILPAPILVATGATGVLAQGLAKAGGSGASDEEVTITRMIGTIYASVDGSGANAVGSGFAIGCLVTRSEALIAGVAAMPDPETDPDAEWIYHTSGMVLRETVQTNTSGPSCIVRVPFDVRGQRVVRTGSTVVWLGSARGVGLMLGANVRYLVKLA